MASAIAHDDWDRLLGGRPQEARQRLRHALDSKSDTDRLALVRRAQGSHLAALFDAAVEPASITDFVPNDAPLLSEFIFDGINSLPLFRQFQKRFTRTEEGVCGYNHTPFNWATTPGYFVVSESHGPSSALHFDYTRLPNGKLPEGWPRPIPNERRLGRFVYAGLVDEVRRVADDVVVGAVFRNQRPSGTYFLLVRRT